MYYPNFLEWEDTLTTILTAELKNKYYDLYVLHVRIHSHGEHWVIWHRGEGGGLRGVYPRLEILLTVELTENYYDLHAFHVRSQSKGEHSTIWHTGGPSETRNFTPERIVKFLLEDPKYRNKQWIPTKWQLILQEFLEIVVTDDFFVTFNPEYFLLTQKY